MRFEEALSLMREGKKVRLPKWVKGVWYELRNGALCHSTYGPVDKMDSGFLLSHGWEEVRTPWREELKDGSFAEAMIGMMHGETWRRLGYPYLGRLATGITFDPSTSFFSEQMSGEDLTATDWERVP